MNKGLCRLTQQRYIKATSRRWMSAFTEEIEAAHLAACQQKQDTYTDPKTGYNVFTRNALKNRGKCCGNGCRHCPYGHFNVAAGLRQNLVYNRVSEPMLLRTRSSRLGKSSSTIYVIFWSAGKNSFLSLRKLMNSEGGKDMSGKKEIVLFTIFNEADGNLPYQGITVQEVMEQAKALKIDLFIVPQKGSSNEAYMSAVFDGLKELESIVKTNRERACNELSSSKIELSLIFGDVSNDACRNWREDIFRNTPYIPVFPIWEMKAKQMLEELAEEKQSWRVEIARCSSTIMASRNTGVEYNEDFIDSLPEGSSPIGEMGEFDTIVKYVSSAK